MPRQLVRIDGGTSDPNDLESLLAVLRPEATTLEWTVRDLSEGVGGDWYAIGRRADSTPGGLPITFPDLESFAGRVLQVINGAFVGRAPDAPAPSTDASDVEVVAASDMVVAAFDSTCWFVSAREPVIARIRAVYPRVSATTLPDGRLTA